jgi:hypothetical protein
MYVIGNTAYPHLYWNNEWGWGDDEGAELFEDMNFNLPLDGQWEEV